MYAVIWRGVQWHSRFGSVRYPHGHGFSAATSMIWAGNVRLAAARLMVTTPSSTDMVFSIGR